MALIFETCIQQKNRCTVILAHISAFINVNVGYTEILWKLSIGVRSVLSVQTLLKICGLCLKAETENQPSPYRRECTRGPRCTTRSIPTRSSRCPPWTVAPPGKQEAGWTWLEQCFRWSFSFCSRPKIPFLVTYWGKEKGWLAMGPGDSTSASVSFSAADWHGAWAVRGPFRCGLWEAGQTLPRNRQVQDNLHQHWPLPAPIAQQHLGGLDLAEPSVVQPASKFLLHHLGPGSPPHRHWCSAS